MHDDTQQLDEAIALLNEYAGVLGAFRELLLLGAPDSLLPAPKSELRQIIRTIVQARARGAAGATDMALLREAYLSLASFLPYDDAHRAARMHKAYRYGDHKYMASAEGAQVLARARGIESDMSALAKEFDEFIYPLETTDLLADIDALLGKLAANQSLTTQATTAK
jgi:hypothetical protein